MPTYDYYCEKCEKTFEIFQSMNDKKLKKCIDEEFLYDNLGARIIKQKLDKYIWQEKNHILVGDLINWCSKYLYLPRVSSKNVIFNALINPNAALTGEKTFYLADSYDENLKKNYLFL